MRRRKVKNNKLLKKMLGLLVFISLIGVGYSYLSGSLNIKGQITGNVNSNYTILPGSNPNLNVSLTQTNNWQDGNSYKYQYSFRVTNIGQDTIDNFSMILNFFNTVNSVSIWNYDYSIKGKTLTIINNNYTLSKQQSVNVDFIITVKNPKQLINSIKLIVEDIDDEITLDEFNVKFNITGSWGTYTYQYNVVVTNKTGKKINGWQLDVTLPTGTSYINGWNAIFSTTNNIMNIKNEKHNRMLKDGESANFGLQLSTNIVNFIPTDIKVTVR